MDALHINTSPNALPFGDLPDLSQPPRDAASSVHATDTATPLQLDRSSGSPAISRQQAVSEAGITSGHSHSHRHTRSRGLPSFSSTHLPAPPTALFPFVTAGTLSPSAAVAGNAVKDSRPGTAVSGTGTSSPSPLFFGPGHKTTPETSLVGASGECITAIDDSTVAHRTSALRELNSSFPSPVFRHRHTKSTGAQSTTYSQPVIVRTYTGRSNPGSTSTHNCRPSSSRRTDSRIIVSRRVQLVSSSRTAVSFTTPASPAASSSNNAAGSGARSLTSSLFGMALSKVKKGGFLPWHWNSNDDTSTPDEAKLPPLEAFTFKGFMADLQSTDIRADLDRIAEICAQSRYSLSNQYEAHMAPHGSGASFAASASQSRSKGRRKGTSSPGGPTLQAVPSDDDESALRAQRRRIGGGKRRSAAYGTLETIMSSSRSSEEDKTKKKPAGEIADEVRGRSVRKSVPADPDTPTGDTGSSGLEQTSASKSTLKSKSGSKPGSGSSSHPKGHQRIGSSTFGAGAEPESESGTRKRDKGKAVQRPRPTTFAHAVIHSNRHKAERHSSGAKEGGSTPGTSGPTGHQAVPALLGEPALPYTTDGSADVYSASGSTVVQSVARRASRAERLLAHSHRAASSTRPSTSTRTRRPDIPVHVTNDGTDDVSQLLALSPEDDAEAGFLSGLTHWIPWVAGGGSGMPEPATWALHSQPQGSASVTAAAPGPSHAEGSLRELLKHVESSTQDKGKVVAHLDG